MKEEGRTLKHGEVFSHWVTPRHRPTTELQLLHHSHHLVVATCWNSLLSYLLISSLTWIQSCRYIWKNIRSLLPSGSEFILLSHCFCWLWKFHSSSMHNVLAEPGFPSVFYHCMWHCSSQWAPGAPWTPPGMGTASYGRFHAGSVNPWAW